MKKTLLLLIILCEFASSQVKFNDVSLEEAFKLAKEQNKILMVDVLTDWCKWCIELDNKVYSRKDVGDFANANQINYKIDAEKGDGIEFAKKYKVQGYPTILFLDANGNEIDRIYGYVPAQYFFERMADYNKGINTFSYLTEKLKNEPDNIDANLRMADKYMELGELDKARKLLERIIELDPLNNRGKTDDAKYKLASISDKKVIIENLTTFIKENPSSDQLRDAYISLAESYYYVNEDTAKAEKYFKDALSFFPDDELVNSSYGQFLNNRAYKIMSDTASSQEQLEKGLLFIEAALPFVKGSVNEASAYYIQSKLFYMLKEYQSALESIEKSLKIFDRKLYREHKESVQSALNQK